MSDPRTDLPAPGAPNFNQRLREVIQTYLGRQGNPLDRGLTIRDLVDTGVLKLRSGFQLKPGAGSSVPLEPGDGVVDTYEPDLTPPPTPGNMTVTASISHVMIEHEAPLYRQGHGHLRTRVYGKVVNAGEQLPTFADAAEIGQFSGTIYAQPSNPATTWRLWTKWETVDGVLSVDPAGGINGLEAITGQDVSKLVFAMTGPGNPFKVVTEQLTLPDDTVVPVGTYTADGFIHNGQITNAKIANLAVDDAKIANVSVDKLTAGTINVGQYIRSSNHVWGQSGWVIDGNGNAEFGAASIRGQLSASQINTEGLTIKENGRVILGAGASLPAQFVSPDGGWLNSNLVPSINTAATTANWSGVSGASKPADGATSGSNLVRKPTFADGSMGAWGAAGISYGDYNNYTSGNFLIFNTRDTYEVGNDFAVIPGETLYVSAAVTSWQSQYTAGLGLAFFNSSGSIFDWRIGAVNPAMTGWNRRKGAVVVPAGAVKAVPWFQIDGPGGQTFPVVWGTEFYIGRAQEGATVGAPAGTYVGDTPAQDVESQNGAQAKANAAQTAAQTYAAAQAELARVSANAHADGKVTAEEQRAIVDASAKAEAARVAAVNAAAQDASNKANAARSGAVSDVTPSINAKLSKAGDTISGRLNFAVSDGIFAGSDTNNGVYFGKDGLVGRKGGQNTFYINTAGDAVFSGTLDAATMNSGRINLQHSGGWDWGYARSYNKWWDDGQNGWVLARHADGGTFMEMRGGSNRIWMSSRNDCGIQFPGITMTNGGLTISQANVINTLNIGPDQVTIPRSAYTAALQTRASGSIFQTVTIESSGSPIAVIVSFSGSVSASSYSSATLTAWLAFDVKRNGTTLASISLAQDTIYTSGNGSLTVTGGGAYCLSDTPGAGSHTYTLHVRGGSGAPSASYCSIVLLETKR